MSSEQIVNNIVNLRRAGMKFGTERTRALLDALGSPDEKLKIIHVAGSNGKGSVCEYLTRILIAAGKRVGTYTTPKVFCFEEQFRIDGKADAALVEKYLKAADDAAEKLEDSPTAYERQTAAAFYMFVQEDCEYAVTECCMGGLLDTTNAVTHKVLALITSVSLEHTAFLGPRLEDIAAHKAGIIKDCPSIISRCVPEEVRGIFFEKGAKLCADVSEIEEKEDGTYFIFEGKRYFTRMQGCRQPYNAALAISAARVLGIEEGAISRGIEEAYLAGRLQKVVARGRIYILDGAHNPESFIPLAHLLTTAYAKKRRTLVYGCLSDKDIDGVLSALSGCAESIIAVQPDSYRAMDMGKIVNACRRHFSDVCTAVGVSNALDLADGDVVAVCGSFTLLKEAMEWTEKRQ